MTTVIHPTAIIADGAVLGEGCQIGPYCVIGAHVRLGARVVLESHVVVAGHTSIGDDCHIWPFASIGHAPQDLKYKGEPTRLVIGARNRIREGVTINPGTVTGASVTVIGDDNLFMANSHVAHDCIVGNHCILANNGTLAGHVSLGDYAIIGGLAAVHQFCRIGRHAMVGGMSGVERDVIPYGSVLGNRAELGGLNLIGLKRRGFDRQTIHALRHAYEMIFEAGGTLAERVAKARAAYAEVEPVQEICDFITADSSRSFCTPRDKA